MPSRLLLLLLLLAISAGCPQRPLATGDDDAEGTLTIAFWNVENLFDEYADRRAPEADVLRDETLQQKLRKDAQVLRALNADIVGLMEVENRGVLRDLCERHLADVGYEYYQLIEETDPRGIDVALISRHPFLVCSFDVDGFPRGVLVGRFSFDGQPLYVVVNHWKSRFNGGEQTRMDCARRVEEIINHIIPQYEGRPVPILIGGDLNDEDTDESVLHLESGGMKNLLKHLPREQRWTLPYNNQQERRVQYQGFDHLFANDVLDRRGLLQEARVEHLEMMLRTRRLYGETVVWPDDDYSDHIGYSDHLPVVARLKKPAAAAQ
jgi:endonuclease/exonuclease/phosphatase family metal-dependent hydrolase